MNNNILIFINSIKSSGNIAIQTDNNLTVESLQDTYYSKTNSSGFNIGLSYSTGTGAFDILRDRGIKLNNSQEIKAIGPAVYKRNWDNGASQILTPRYKVISKDSPLGTPGTVIDSNIKYKHHENDGVRDVAAPRSPYHFAKGVWNLIFNINQHGVDSYKND